VWALGKNMDLFIMLGFMPPAGPPEANKDDNVKIIIMH
jgi:hypothetical protein